MFSGDADLSLYDYNNAESNIDLKRVVQDTDYYSIGQKKYLIYKIKPLNKFLFIIFSYSVLQFKYRHFKYINS